MIKEEDIINTNDEELIMLYRENDEDAKNILFYKYKYLIDVLIKKNLKVLKTLGVDNQEIYSECNVGFSDALKSYSSDEDASLKTFIALCIERRLMNLIRRYSTTKYKTIKGSYSLDYYYEDNKNLLDLISYDTDPLNSISEKEDYNELIKEIENALTSSEKEVFKLMINGIKYNEIASILKKTPKQIDNTIQRIKNKIKKIVIKRN